MVTHKATLRVGIVGPGEPGHRVFESNFVMECSCGRTAGYATTERATAERWMAEHLRWHEFRDSGYVECDTEAITCHCGCDGPCDVCDGSGLVPSVTK